MHINIRYKKDRKISKAIRQRVEQKLDFMGRYLEEDHPLHLSLSSEKDGEHAELHLYFQGHDIHAKASEKTLYEAIDLAIEHAGRQLEKIVEKMKNHKGNERVKARAAKMTAPISD